MTSARLNTLDGKTTEWRSQALRAYQRCTLAADALITGCYLSGTNTRRALFGGAAGKDAVPGSYAPQHARVILLALRRAKCLPVNTLH